MLGKLLSPFTAPGPGGTTFRDLIVAIGPLITLLATLGAMTTEQVEALQKIIDAILGNWTTLAAAFGALSTIAMMIYRAVFKSRTPEGEAVGKAVDKAVANDTLPANTPIGSVELQTPRGMDNITVPVAPVK